MLAAGLADSYCMIMSYIVTVDRGKYIFFKEFINIMQLFFYTKLIDFLNLLYVTLDHKTRHKSLGYICTNSQKYILWVKMIDFSFMPQLKKLMFH